MKKFFFATFFVFLNSCLWANIKLPALVDDNMVLQRDAKITLWGWADDGEKVSVYFQNQQFKTKAGKDKKWTIVLSPLPAGGPYEMIIKGKNSITIKNIMIGDVWLASGQSNMEWPLNNINKSKIEIATADYSDIRLLTVNKRFSFQPTEEISSNGWMVCSPKTVDSFSAVAHLFGRELHQRYKVPIGLIHSSWGGTTAEAWTSADGLKSIAEFKEPLEAVAKMDMSTYEAFRKKREAWFKNAGAVDRGRSANSGSWADQELNTSDWNKMTVPGFWSRVKDLKGFGGVIWFRKEIDIPAESAGKPLELRLGRIIVSDSTFFNGKCVGATTGYENQRIYTVPGDLVKTGRNVVVLRIMGVLDFGGMIAEPEEIYAEIDDRKIPLSGEWMYKTGPDLNEFPQLDGLNDFKPIIPQSPTVLFNAMIAPLIPYAIKGVIWYQGESNADSIERAKQYSILFPALITDWRHRWGDDFPFLFVQLAGFQADKPEPADYPWAYLRESQYKSLSFPKTGMATAIDIGDEKDIHPRNKQDVAHRLAMVAQRVAYNENIVASGPGFKSMNVQAGKVIISFDNIGSGLWTKDKYGYIRGFAIAGADKKFVWAKAYQQGNDVFVYSDSVKQPVAVRYNWGNTPDGNLYNKENLPAVPFRTDDW